MARKKSVKKSRMKKKSVKESKLDMFFMLSWKKVLLLIILWFASVILHNLIYAFFHMEEAVFFLLAIIVIPLYFLISLIYSLVGVLRGKNKITLRLVISILIGLLGGFVVNYLGYFRGPWFFALISLFIAFVVYRIIQFVFAYMKK
jgi:hypothetical protein